MIYLTLDIGNTSCTAAIFRNHKVIRKVTVRTNVVSDIKSVLSQWDEPVGACIASSVVKGRSVLEKYLRSKTKFIPVRQARILPVKNTYLTPETLGSDRLSCAIGGHSLFPASHVLVIDAGTCIKYDFVDSKGNYLGGSISPGMLMRLHALHDYTSGLPFVEPAEFGKLSGRNTRQSIITGVLHGIRYEIEGFIHSYKSKYRNLKIVMTGGDMPRLVKYFKNDIFAAPHLIHIGLYEILKKNLA